MNTRNIIVLSAAGVLLANAMLVAAQESATTTLETVVVTSDKDGGYVEKTATAATKTDTPVLETPMSVQSVTREVMDDQQILSVQEAVQNVSGVVQNSYTFYDFIQIRGFDNGYAANYRNGLQLQAISGLETALFEHIEVVKGPASMLFGRIEPGGLVNMVTKRPQAEAAASVQQQIGTDGLYRTTADATGKLDEQGTLLYRAIGVYKQVDSFMDYVQDENRVGAFYLTWAPSERFIANLDLEAQNYKFVDTEDQGIPIANGRPVDVPRDSYYGDPVNWNLPNRQNRRLVGGDWTYTFNDEWKITQRVHWDGRDEQQLTFWSNGFDGVSQLGRGVWFVQPERETVATNVDLIGDLDIGGMRHRVLAGVDWFRFTSDWQGFSGTTSVVPSVNIYAPIYGIPAQSLLTLPHNFFYSTYDGWKGLYVQDQISLTDRWELLLGGRYDWAEYGNGYSARALPEAEAAIDKPEDKAFSPRVGVLYKLTPAQSLYASYSQSFGTNNGRSVTGATFDPQEGEQYEAGYKQEWLEGRLVTTAAVFVLDKSNLLTDDLSTPAPDDQIAVGTVRSQGIELDITGQLTDNLSIISSYTFDHARVTEDRSGNQGNTQPNVPMHAASLWLKYDFSPGAPQGWEVGAGSLLRSSREGDVANSWNMSGYGIANAMVGYRMQIAGEDVSFQLNAQNLFDKTYIDRGGFSSAKYGDPRSVIGSVEVRF